MSDYTLEQAFTTHPNFLAILGAPYPISSWRRLDAWVTDGD